MTAHIQVDISTEAIADIASRHHVRELRLFGSVLRDDFHSDSDIDMLVEFDPDARVGLFSFFALQDELCEMLGRKVDLVSKRGLHWVIRDDVLAASQVVYAV